MNTLLVFIVVLGAAALHSHPVDPDLDLERLWREYKIEYDFHFDSDAEIRLKGYFEKAMKYVHDHNILYNKGLSGYKLKFTHYAHYIMMGHHLKHGNTRGSKFASRADTFKRENSGGLKFVSRVKAEDLPKEVDWRRKGIVSKPGKQLMCGSCYAFSSAGAIEGHMALKTGKLIPVSVQEIVDCTNQGCGGGGLMTTSFEYFTNHEIHSNESYPYVDKDQKTCQLTNDSAVGKLSGYVEIEEGNEQDLMEAVATIGPVSVGIAEGNEDDIDFHLFGEGVFDLPGCPKEPALAGHAILIVGYGSENGKDYWITKNSFGEKWGEDGYMKIPRNSNHCGIANFASYPLI